MADRIAVMARGSIEQVSSPTEIYDRPQTLFVNEFVGSTNLLPGKFASSSSGAPAVQLQAGVTFPVTDGKSLQSGSPVVLSIRPEQLRIQPSPSDGDLAAVIATVMPLGAHVVYDVTVGQGTSLKVSEPREAATAMRAVGATIYLRPASPGACHVFPST